MFSCVGEEVKRLQFQGGGNYNASLREGSFEMYGDRVIKLGTNMWASTTSQPHFKHGYCDFTLFATYLNRRTQQLMV